MSTINGTPGDDILSGTSGDDIVSGGAGNDRIDGGSGSHIWDILAGDDGDDILLGTPDHDNIHGGAGNDWIDGGAGGSDHLYGDDGNDTLIIHSGSSPGILDGGAGIDTVVLDYDWSPITQITPGGSPSTVNLRYGSVSNVEYAQFTNKTIALFGPYLVTVNWAGVAQNRALDFSSDLLQVERDLSGLTITQYQLYDGNSDPNSGHFVINGVAQPAGTVITITATQTAQTSFVTGTVNDSLQIRAFDGTYWSAADNELWASFKIMVQPNTPAILTTADVNVTPGQAYALSSLFSVSDSNHDTITRYQLFDASPDPASGHIVVNGVVQSAETTIDLAPMQLAQTYFVVGTDINALLIRAFDGSDWSAPSGSTNAFWSSINFIPPNPSVNHTPVVTTSMNRVAANTALPLSSLFSVSDADGDTITRYQFDVWKSGLPPDGHFVVNGVAKYGFGSFDLTAAQAAQATFVTGSGVDFVSVRVFDGTNWNSTTLSSSPYFKVGPLVNHAPVVATAPMAASHSQTIALSSLTAVSDSDSDPMTKYQLWDASDDPASGHFVINGVAQAERSIIEITAAQAAQTSFVTGLVNDTLQIRAFDGIAWSAPDNDAWSPFTISIAPNHAPVVATTNKNAAHAQNFSLSGLITVSDADSDPITKYQLWDATDDAGSGYFVINGVVQTARTVIDLTPSQVAQTSFVSGIGASDTVHIRAYDGVAWSAPNNGAWSPFTVSVSPNHAPVVTTSNRNAAHSQSFALSSLMTVSDADSDPVTKYQLWDATDDPGSGNFVINGVVQTARTIIDLTPSQVAQTSFVTGIVNDSVHIRAYDGGAWSAPNNGAWSPFTVSVPPNHAPVLTGTNQTLPHSQPQALSSLITVSDADNDSITRYQLWDATADPLSGHFVINGVAQAERSIIDITAAQLAQTSFVTGSSLGDTLQIRAFDGFAWSAPDNGAWSPFHISVS